MEPTLEDGDTMLVDRGVSEIREDGIFVIALDDELYIKRVQRRLPDKAIIIKADIRILLGMIIAAALGLAGLMAKGFGWF